MSATQNTSVIESEFLLIIRQNFFDLFTYSHRKPLILRHKRQFFLEKEIFFQKGLYIFLKISTFALPELTDGVIGNTSDFGSEESRFETWSVNK